MAKNIQMAKSYDINIDSKYFNPSFYPYLYKIFNYEIYWGGRGGGKCFAKGTRVVMIDGEFKNVEDVVVGDQLMGIDSTPRTVLNLSSGFGKLYNVHQYKGIDYVVNENHVLCLEKSHACRKTLKTKQRYTSFDKYTEISIKDYLGMSKRWKTNFRGYRVAVEFKQQPILIDPYFLGVWLGDGTSKEVAITTMDKEIKEYIHDYAKSLNHIIKNAGQKGKANAYRISLFGNGHPQYIRDEWAKIVAVCPNTTWSGTKSISSICERTKFSRKNIALWKKQQNFIDKVNEFKLNPVDYDLSIITDYLNELDLRERFQKYNLFNNKHIPNEYLYGSTETRLQVLAGLIDTDGNLSKNCFDVIFKNKRLAEQTKYLANSLGLRCSINECQKTCCNNGVVGTYHRLNISGKTHIIPTKLPRKQITSYSKILNPMITGITVEYLKKGDYYGFEVSGDHKFLLEDFTVTHNSRYIAQKLVLQMSTLERRNLIAMRKQATDCRNSCFAVIYKIIHEFKLQDMWDIRENPDMRMFNKVTRSEIIFTGMDKAENVKSLEFKEGSATDLWYEELTEEQFEDNITTLDNSIRSYDEKCRLIVSFNPPLNSFWIISWLKNKFKNKAPEITKSGIIEVDVNGIKVLSDYLIHHSTYKDNKWNFKLKPNGDADYNKPNSYVAKLEGLKFDNPYKYRTDCLGLTGTSGESVFNANKISDRIMFLGEWFKNNPPTQVQFSYQTDEHDLPILKTIKPESSIIGETMIYFMPNPKRPYVASLDTAGEGIDNYVLQVCDNVTDDVVAVFCSPKLADECMIQVYGLLKLYNDALVAPEVNFSEYPMMKLKEWEYTNIYQREDAKDNYSDGLTRKLGFRMTSGNRQSVIDNLIEWSKTNLDKIYDLETLNEMLTFTRQNKKNKGIFMGAESGANDDRVIALCILLKAKEQQSAEEQAEMKHIEGYWTHGELEVALYKGKVDEMAVKEYIENNKQRFDKTNRRVSRYAR